MTPSSPPGAGPGTGHHDPRVPLALVAVACAAYGLAVVPGWAPPAVTSWIAAAGVIVASAAAATALLYGARCARRQGEEWRSRAWLLFGMAGAAWCVGELVHGVLQLAVGRGGFPLTLGDMFSLLALPLMLAGFAAASTAPRGLRPASRLALDTWVCAASLFALLWVGLFAPLYWALGQSPGAYLIDLMYPIVDVATVCLALAFAATARPADRGALAVAYVAVLGVASADVANTALRLRGAFAPGGWVDVVWFGCYLLLASVPWLAAGPATAERVRRPRRPGRGTLLMPAVSGVLIVAVTVAALARPRAMDPVVSLLAGSVGLALLARLGGMLVENGRLRRAVTAGERRFTALVEGSGDAVLICDLAGRVRYLSPVVERMYGCPPDELVGRTLDEHVHPEDLPRMRDLLREFLAEGQTDDSVRLRCRIRGADGTWRHTEAIATRHVGTDRVEGLLFAARDVSDQVALQEELAHLAFHDRLTGLPNRAYFQERTRQMLARPGHPPSGVAVMFLDLDGFTAVNDSVGHTSGDVLLAHVARRLRAATPIADTVARFGADEFAVLVETRGETQAVVDLAERVIHALSGEPYRLAGREIVLTASVGVAFAEEGLAGTDLMRNADVAMARAKSLGGARMEVFRAHMHADVVRRLELRSELRKALDEGQFAIEYQPVVDLLTSRVVAVEALVRWWRGSVLVPPEDFIRPAEELGLIAPLGQWVLREACRQAAAWRESSWDIGLSVNLSAKQIVAPGFLEVVSEALECAALPPDALTLEVTEEVLVENVGPTIERLSQLRELGVRLAIDDFGTGYASLAYLRQLPVDVIKIDPSFVAGVGLDDHLTLLTRTILRLGDALGLVVVAEGIERPEQLDLLRGMGCTRGQGYLVARPMAARGVESVLRTSVSTGRAGGLTSPLTRT